MKQKYYTFILLLLSLSLSSCYKEIDLDKYRTQPKIVINCAISPDNVIMPVSHAPGSIPKVPLTLNFLMPK